MDLRDTARSLADVLPVDELTPIELETLLAQARGRRFEREEVIYHAGDPAREVHVVVSGAVKLTRSDDTGREALLWVLERGGIFGQQAVFGRLRPTDAVAISEVQTIALIGTTCAQVLEANPRIMLRAFAMIEQRLERLTASLEDALLRDVPGRLAKYLLEFHPAGRAPLEIELTQDELAAAVGSTRVTVNKVLASWEARGLVTVSRRHISVRDPRLLRGEIR
jgi:CRP-like cAMP-binding protein